MILLSKLERSILLSHTGCPKTCIQDFYLQLDGWDKSPVIGGICRSVWSTKTFLHDIRELRYKQNKMGYQISRIHWISWNRIPPGFIPNFSSYGHFSSRGSILPLVCFRFKPISIQHKGAEIWDIRFKEKRSTKS